MLSPPRSYDHCGKSFVATKTKAGIRAVPLASWLVEELRVHVEGGKLESESLLFTTPTGKPFYPTYVRRFLWTKLIARAGVRVLDMYSLRHTFASLARSSGEASFNVARTMGHAYVLRWLMACMHIVYPPASMALVNGLPVVYLISNRSCAWWKGGGTLRDVVTIVRGKHREGRLESL